MNKRCPNTLLAALFVVALLFAFCAPSSGVDPNTPTYADATPSTKIMEPAAVPRNNGVPVVGYASGSEYVPVRNESGKRLPVEAFVTISTITAALSTGSSNIGDIGGVLDPLPSGTNDLGRVKRTPYTTASYSNVTLTPGTPYSIPLMTGVDSMTISNSSTSGEFWIGLKTATVAISTGMKAYSSVELGNIDLDAISIIASTALPISIIQLGY